MFMFISKIPNRNSPPSYLLRESYRENGEVKKRTLANLTKLGPAIIAKIQEELKGNKLVPVSEIFETTKNLPHGAVDAVLTAIRNLKLDQIIDPNPSRQRNLVLAMIAQRILSPTSKLQTRHYRCLERHDARTRIEN
ncbi:MAG: hypothetical protein LBQ66_14125 [Planctomycetaceae bacterium]|jgi:hypothetical protein|nr:hypothetical protein [Planctomycetaceae bacterium]